MKKVLATASLAAAAVSGVGVVGATSSSAASVHLYQHNAAAGGYTYSDCRETAQAVMNRARAVGGKVTYASGCTKIRNTNRYTYERVVYRSVNKAYPTDFALHAE